MTASRSITRSLHWNEVLVAGLLVLGVATGRLPPVPVRVPPAAGAVLGLAAGSGLFRLLAGRWGSVRLPARAASGAVLDAILGAVTLAGRAACEELAWRGFFLGALVRVVGPPAALAVATALFAAAHHGPLGRLRLVHALTGGVFGVLYLATGRLVAAIAAHVAYNALVASASLPGGTS